MKSVPIEAILFDSGKVLNYPPSGHWFITSRFFSQVDQNIYESISKDKRKHAFSKAGNYINSIAVIQTKEEEYEHFLKFYEIFSNELPELKLEEAHIRELAKDLVFHTDKYKFFEDAVKVIPLLREKYKLAVVSDAWPSLQDVFIDAGLYSYFSSFVISSVIGVTKPNAAMYMTALEELRIKPEYSIFIDDNVKNCLGAKKLGINALLLCRDKRFYTLQKILSIGKEYKVINSLDELLYIENL